MDASDTVTNEAQDGSSQEKEILGFEFTGDGKSYFKIWIVNILLSLVTLGIYSAWAKVRSKNYFYGNTRLNSSSFQYTGKPIAILKGRIVLGILTICYVAAGQYSFIAPAIVGLFFLAAWPWLFVRAQIFNTTNSIYRNIRFGFDKDYAGSYRFWWLYGLLSFVTLGLIIPKLEKDRRAFVAGHSYYGKTKFSFKGLTKDFYKVYAGAMGIYLGAIVLGGLSATVFMLILPPTVAGVATVLITYAGLLFSVAHINASMFNLLWRGANLESIEFKSKQNSVELMKIYFENAIKSIFSLGLYLPWALIAVAKYKAETLQVVCDKGDFDKFTQREFSDEGALGEASADMWDLDVGIW